MSAETIPFAPSPHPLLFEPASLPPGGIVMSLDEYRQLVRTSETRYEYVDCYAIPKDGVEVLENGEIRAMSGSAPLHNEVAGNVHFKIKLETRGHSCKTYFADVRVRVTPTKYRYPDVVALREEAQFDGDNPACLHNPSVLVEVLSSST